MAAGTLSLQITTKEEKATKSCLKSWAIALKLFLQNMPTYGAAEKVRLWTIMRILFLTQVMKINFW